MPIPSGQHVPAVEPGPDQVGDERFSPAHRRRLSGPGLRTFLGIAEAWGLTELQRRRVLGMPARSTWYNWLKSVRAQEPITLDLDVLLRISAVLGIHQALGILFRTQQEAVDWLHGPHAAPLFGNQPPMDLVTCGTQDGLLSVRRFLDAARGGLYMPPNSLDTGFPPLSDNDIVFT